MTTKIDLRKILEAIKQIKKKFLIGLLILVIIIIGVILLLGKTVRTSLGQAVFYYKGDGKDTKLFYLKSNNKPIYLTTLPSQEVDIGKYKVPQRSFISHDGKILIYFEKTGQKPVESLSSAEQFTVQRILYKPKYINLTNNSVKEIGEDLDSSGVVFSPNDKQIAWILRVDESTIDELVKANKKREVWISDYNGENAKRLAVLDDEKVVTLQAWDNDYIYFLGTTGVGYYSLGKINTNNGKVERIKPKFCSEDLINCQRFQFSSSGNLFIYEAATVKDNKEVLELFAESFDGKSSWQILVKNYISDHVWTPDEKSIIYTEQITPTAQALQEKIHLVNLNTGKDKEIYSGSYVSQLISDSSGEHLYFIEKETDQKFNLVRLEIGTGKTKIIDFGEPNQLAIFSGI